MRLDKEWFERMLQLRKRSQDEKLNEKERESANKAFTTSLKKIKLQDVLKKKKEELQYLPIGWILEIYTR